MHIRHFSAEGIHGYLKFDIEFNDDITFLTGINGSGKTTVVYSIVSLVTPSFFILANLEFTRMTLLVEQDNNTISITASRDNNNTVFLGTSNTHEQFILPQFTPEPDELPYRVSDAELQFYRNMVSEHSSHPVIRLINTLPTPMFLDIDRRPRAGNESAAGRMSYYSRLVREGRNIFNAPLIQSLAEAVRLAEAQNQQLTRDLLRLGDQLRRDIILNLLTMETTPDQALASLPSARDRATISTMRQTIGDLPNILQLSIEDVRTKIIPFLDRLGEAVDKIPDNMEFTVVATRDADPMVVQTFLYWYSNQQQLRIFNAIIQRVEQFNHDRKLISTGVNTYLSMINGYLNDSGKTLLFNERGALVFLINNTNDERPLSALSSGEAQICVILTHLAFNPAAQQANIFVIDEPELSLHVQWQENFVESVVLANPTVQYIMATHSPSIILDRLDKCVDIREGRRSLD